MAIYSLLYVLRSQSRSLRSGDRLTTLVSCSHAYIAKVGSYQVRWTSRAATLGDNSIGPREGREVRNEDKDTRVVYYCSNFMIKKLYSTMFSQLCIGVSSVPIIFMIYPYRNVVVTDAGAEIIIGFVATSVILGFYHTRSLYRLVRPYVHEIRWQLGSESFEFESMSWFGTNLSRTVKFVDIRPPSKPSNSDVSWFGTNLSRIIKFLDFRPSKPMSTSVPFEANGRSYVIDTRFCREKMFLTKLGEYASVPEKDVELD